MRPGEVFDDVLSGTGFFDDYLGQLWHALLNMWDHDSSASKGVMACRGLYVFKHVGTDSDEKQRVRQAMLGCAPAQRLLDFSSPGRKLDNTIIEKCHCAGLTGSARRFADYTVTAYQDRLSNGVELIMP